MSKVKKVGSLLRSVVWLIMKVVTLMLAVVSYIIPPVAKASANVTNWLQQGSSKETA